MDSLQGHVVVPISVLARNEREGGIQPEVRHYHGGRVLVGGVVFSVAFAAVVRMVVRAVDPASTVVIPATPTVVSVAAVMIMLLLLL